MNLPDNEWEMLRDQGVAMFGGAVRISLLFGSAAVALALFLAPVADRYSRPQLSAGSERALDFTATGSVAKQTSYTIRRSVLQASPASVCIIRGDGRQSGDC